LFAENYQVKALSGGTTVSTENIPSVLADSSINGFANFSVSSTPAQPITQVLITTTSNIDINGWDFFVDTITISAVPEPSSAILCSLWGLATLGCRAWRKLRKA